MFIGFISTNLLCWVEELGALTLDFMLSATSGMGIAWYPSWEEPASEMGDTITGEDPAEEGRPKMVSKLLLIFNIVLLPWLIVGTWTSARQQGQMY